MVSSISHCPHVDPEFDCSMVSGRGVWGDVQQPAGDGEEPPVGLGGGVGRKSGSLAYGKQKIWKRNSLNFDMFAKQAFAIDVHLTV